MKIVIEIPENEYRHIKEYYEKNDIVESIYSYVYHGTPLPNTNGKVLMTMFPPSVYYGKDKRLVLLAKDVCLECNNDDWWNAEWKGVTDASSD